MADILEEALVGKLRMTGHEAKVAVQSYMGNFKPTWDPGKGNIWVPTNDGGWKKKRIIDLIPNRLDDTRSHRNRKKPWVNRFLKERKRRQGEDRIYQ